ncbi:CaiB/BaiF CoA-transferase family protein [Bacillus sp. B15-48]|uniref:CaiB/BaiF CoA transferase family protein n=1 Tax=Bacillus sp. B15-48 TaxID=1548601 RepID=UPI00193F9FDE|nr:CaiB/BaiF CoA-transferase family protein [Bacillus sp. B15-48]MBM4763714.1 hypothetical protein [Bacillus sp. B15-48]
MAGALAGLKILDLSRVLAGPYCTMILSDLGAEVIKVKAPGGSDDTRAWGPPYRGGESAYYMSANRNKQAITVNLKTEQGKEIIEKLINQSDIVIENFKTGTMERLGLGYEDLKAINPKIIHCSITGFGKNGPYKDLPGYDYIIQAMAGPINNLEELFQDEQIAARKMVQEIEHPTAGPISLVGSPLKLSRTPAEVRTHPPLVGEHNDVILKNLDFTEEEINQLKRNKVI